MLSDSSHTALSSTVAINRSCNDQKEVTKLRSVTLGDGRALFCDRVGVDSVIVQDSRTFFFLTGGWTNCAYTGKWNVFCNGWVGDIVIVQDDRTFF